MQPSPQPHQPPRRAPNLERDKVVIVALELLNEVGFEGLTLRKLAATLDVKAAALYWHFENKQDLIDQLAARIIADEISSGHLPDNATWREVFVLLAYASRGALRRYRDGALVIARADMSKTNSFEGEEQLMGRLAALGFPGWLAVEVFFAISRHTLGSVLEEQAAPHTPTERAMMGAATVAVLAEKYPAMGAAFQASYDRGVLMDADRQFKAGLELILDGVEARLASLPQTP
jgi:TetR/AcrR family tetracycline transcriptional repressor